MSANNEKQPKEPKSKNSSEWSRKHHPNPHCLSLRGSGFGWMLVYFDEHTGTVVVHSDFGSSVFSWTGIASHHCLRSFFAQADNGYVLSKFQYVQTELRADKLDVKSSKEGCMAAFDERYPPDEGDMAEEREFFEEQVDCWLDQLRYNPSEYPSEPIVEVLGSEFYEHIHKHSPKADAWCKHVLPVIRQELKARHDHFGGWAGWQPVDENDNLPAAKPVRDHLSETAVDLI